MSESADELYQERLKRVTDAIELRVPDRVPVSTPFGYFPAKYCGILAHDAFYDYPKWKQAYQKTVIDYEPDLFRLVTNESGQVLEAVISKQTLWPGHGVPETSAQQFVEGEYMTADEYDMFLYNRADFIIRHYLPRVYGLLEPLAALPPLNTQTGMIPYHLLATPEFSNLLSTLVTASRQTMKWRAETGTFAAEMDELGYPSYGMFVGLAPFDVISDNFRGMRGAMLDMYRNPDKLLEACDVLLLQQAQMIKEFKISGRNNIGFMPLHRGADGFMSNKQFETFYWPTLKQHIINVIDAGITPCVFFEGDYTSRLEYLLELPKGKVLGQFDSSDIVRVKEVLNNHMCIMGNVPPSLLQTGSTQDVRDYCKWLIDVVGKGGGFIMSPRSAIDEVKPENLKMMFDFTREYGVYS